MLRHLGYIAATRPINAHDPRIYQPGGTARDLVREQIRENLRDLDRVFRFNVEREIAFFRVGSQVIPFASYPGNAIAWWDEFACDLERLGYFVRRHDLRLEMHPGHHCLLNAPSPETVALSILELGWHVRFFDAMRLDASHKLALRIGGAFGDKTGSLDRFVSVVQGLPFGWRRRLVVENDDTIYGLADVLHASAETGLPVVFARPCEREYDSEVTRLVARSFRTWRATDGAPIVHLGNSSPDRRTMSRADSFEPNDIESLSAVAPPGVAFDCLLESKQGETALLGLRTRMKAGEYGDPEGHLHLSPAPMG